MQKRPCAWEFVEGCNQVLIPCYFDSRMPPFRGIFMPFPFLKDKDNIKTTHKIKIKLQGWLSSCFKGDNALLLLLLMLQCLNKTECLTHVTYTSGRLFQSISWVHFSTGTCCKPQRRRGCKRNGSSKVEQRKKTLGTCELQFLDVAVPSAIQSLSLAAWNLRH